MELKITIEAADLASSIRELAEAIAGRGVQLTTPSIELSVQQQPAVQPIAPQALAQVPQQPAAPQAPAPTPQPAAPVSTAPTYTLEQLSVAAMQLMDAGRQQELIALLHRYGVPALTQLPRDAYGAFSTDLRQLGVKL